jgi:hypothetical protein
MSLSHSNLSLLRSPRLLSLSLSLRGVRCFGPKYPCGESDSRVVFVLVSGQSLWLFSLKYFFFISSVSQQPNPCFGYLCRFVFLGFWRL